LDAPLSRRYIARQDAMTILLIGASIGIHRQMAYRS
jgi:hypothetical protein